RVISDPSAFPTGINQLGRKSQLLGNPADGIVHFDTLVGAEVEDVHLVPRPFQGDKNRVDAILNIQIRFLLPPVTQHLQLSRIGPELAKKIENVAVRVAFPQNGYKAKDPSLEAEAFRVSGDEAFPR